MSWKLIDTVPAEVNEILGAALWDGRWETAVYLRRPGGWGWGARYDVEGDYAEPTIWHPLPDLPIPYEIPEAK